MEHLSSDMEHQEQDQEQQQIQWRRDKIQELYIYPWFELFKGFKHDLSKTKNWISIGYSFNDEFIRNIFHEALNEALHKFVIVAPDANGIVSDKFSIYRQIIS
jgi:hypothetical protein